MQIEFEQKPSQIAKRPPIKNNLNEQLNIYLSYRDESSREKSKFHSKENLKSSQIQFRPIPDRPPIIRPKLIQIENHSTTTEQNLFYSSSNLNNNQSINIRKESIVPSSTLINSTTNKSSINHSTDDQIRLKNTEKSPEKKFSSTSTENKTCPICKNIFDCSGTGRPVSDACGHTTCFQCFKIAMLDGNGCQICLKSKENIRNSFQNNSSIKSNVDQKLDKFDDDLFDDWSLDNLSNNKIKQESKSTFDHRFETDENDENDFENISSIEEEEQSDKVKWINSDVQDDGPEYHDRKSIHIDRMLERFHALFGLKKFRSNQQEAIICALERRFHVFVLMPTGGGKSLCYQLPAVLDDGITFVVSPLRSLILDQTQKLTSLGIHCAALTGDRTPSEVSDIYAQCYSSTTKLKLIYITPEKIGQSDQVNKLFSYLYTRNKLSRFVIDEAHCISDWGHDFRPDYVKIGGLRERFPLVPFTLLTATATPRVQRDMLHQMKIERHLSKLFIQSFNRSNLIYKCFLKGKTESALARTVELCLSEQFVGLCGIVYCFSRAECEKSANYLSKSGVTAQAYHAGLDDQERTDVQTKWANDEYQVICATIAFGMGIDKPNVRFVIHLSMPKSIEGYYQESGRAGRDGETAFCYLFFSYQDLVKTKRLIMTEQTSNATREATKVRIENLHRVYAYCLNNVDCRRTLLLEYFGEQYSSSQCKKHRQTRCDNCCSVAQTESVDFTDLSIKICSLVEHLTKNGRTTTINQIVDIVKGSKQRGIKEAGHDKLEQFNVAEDVSRTNVERLLSKLILENYLHQDISINDTYGTANAYIRLGSIRTFSNRIYLSICVKKENFNPTSFVQKGNSTKTILIDECLIKLKNELRSIASEHNIKYSTILTEKALKQMSSLMPKSKDEILKKVVEMTTIKYDLYKLDRLLSITSNFRSKLDDQLQSDSLNFNLKRKREMNKTITSSYFHETNNQQFKKKK